MGTVKGFWQHRNGKIYAVESTTFGQIIAAAGPLEAEKLGNLEDYEYKRGIVDWVERAVAEGTLRLYRPGEKQQKHFNKALRVKWIRRFILHRALLRRIGL